VNFLSTYSDKKFCNTSTTLQSATRGLSAIGQLLVKTRTWAGDHWSSLWHIATTIRRR